MDNLIKNLRAIVGPRAVLSEPNELIVYECDGLPQHKYPPRAVVFPISTEQTSEVMRVLADAGVPFTPRGAGTGLSGGALALNRGVVIELARMRNVLSIDEGNRTAVVQTGVVNAHVSKAVAHLGLHYVPDPSSQGTCTIGGNLAENAGGIHCLKYGTTTDHVIGARVVLAGGEIVDLGSSERGTTGYDLLGAFVGSEGTFGIATEATLRLVPVPPAVRTLLAEFPDVNDASHAVSAIIAAGVMPAALEMMDGEIIRAVEASIFAAGLSLDIGAALLVELDGLEAGLDEEAERVKNICIDYRARTCRLARDENERKKLWAARKGAFGAVGRIAPDSMIQDAVVPRSRLPEVLAAIYTIASKYELRLANVFHAGDGNLHPFICFDSRSPDQVGRVKEAGRELMETCVAAGGTITGEHGVGLDKREFLPLIFSDDDMDTMLRVRAAFDPLGLCNPGKIIPMLRGCGEARVLSEPGAVATGSSQVLSEPGAVATGSSQVLSEPRAVATGSSQVLSEPRAVATGSSQVLSEPRAVATGSSQVLSEPRAVATGSSQALSEPGAVATGSSQVLSEPRAVATGSSQVLSEPGAVATGSVRASELLLHRSAGSLGNLEVDATERRSHSALLGGKAAGNARQPFDTDDAAKQLSAIVGEANIALAPSLRVSASVLITPGSIEEVSEVMKLAQNQRWTMVPAGAATWLDAGNQLPPVDLVVSIIRLNRVLEHIPADLVASAQAGVTLQDFDQALAAGGQWLPLDPPDDGPVTLGGAVATGLAGAQKCGYGTPRNFVIGMRVVLPDGKLVKAGGRVVKNVAGYDLCKLFTGSYGTLGLIAELTFKLRPRPAKEVTVIATGALEAILIAAQSIQDARLFPVAVELVSPALAHRVGFKTAGRDVLLLTRFAGIAKTVSYQVEEGIGRIRHAAEIVSVETESDDNYLWRRLAAAATNPDEVLSWRATVRQTGVGNFIKTVKDTNPDYFAQSFWHAGVADGRVRMMEPVRATNAEDSSRLANLRNIAESFGGSLVIESAPEEIKLAMDAWGRRGNSDNVMNRIKDQLDPQGMFSPGRF